MNKAEMIELYQKVLNGEKILANNDSVQTGLKLAGLISEKVEGNERYLQCRNLIFAKTFDWEWINQELSDNFFYEAHTKWMEATSQGETGAEFFLRGQVLKDAWKLVYEGKATKSQLNFIEESENNEEEQTRQLIRLEEEAKRAEVESKRAKDSKIAARKFRTALIVVAILAVGLLVTSIYSFTQARRATDAATRATEAEYKALQSANEAFNNQKIAEDKTKETEFAKNEIEKQRIAAEESEIKALKNQKIAETEKLKADAARLDADKQRDVATKSAKELDIRNQELVTKTNLVNQSLKEATKARQYAEDALIKANQEKKRADDALIEATNQKNLAENASDKAIDTLAALESVDNQTPKFNAIFRFNSSVNTAVFFK